MTRTRGLLSIIHEDIHLQAELLSEFICSTCLRYIHGLRVLSGPPWERQPTPQRRPGQLQSQGPMKSSEVLQALNLEDMVQSKILTNWWNLNLPKFLLLQAGISGQWRSQPARGAEVFPSAPTQIQKLLKGVPELQRCLEAANHLGSGSWVTGRWWSKSAREEGIKTWSSSSDTFSSTFAPLSPSSPLSSRCPLSPQALSASPALFSTANRVAGQESESQ